MITIPEDFAIATINREGDAGRQWIDHLPNLVEGLCQQWGLVIDGRPMHGYLGLVVPVRQGSERCALKVAWRDESTAHEAIALATWNGKGAVRLLAAEPTRGAMLLERLNSRRTLNDVGVEEAIAVAGHLLRRLAVPAPEGLARLKEVGGRLSETLPERWERYGRPMPRRQLEVACDLAVQLGASAGGLLVNYDLHYADVLAGEREPWLAVDPKVVVGDPEYGVAQLLWRRLEDMQAQGGLDRHFQALIEAAELDSDLARSWTLIRCVDYWLWGLSVGLTEDPARCKVILDWLA
ncbi:MAG TPA: aminoglycoside phosphotransferase family protein [Chthonomonadaceae bacterium]|nr:aminoglycoside phosphotransferase family protein [Chthonomonadaceae bacterium]